MTTATNHQTTHQKVHPATKTASKLRSSKGASKTMVFARQKQMANASLSVGSIQKGQIVVNGQIVVTYHRSKGVDDFVYQISNATPLELVEVERKGVAGGFLKDLSKRMAMPAARVFTMLGVPKATAEKKAAAGEVVSGSGGQAAIGMAKLLGIAQSIVGNSTAADARNFDSAKWLGHWLEREQPSL